MMKTRFLMLAMMMCMSALTFSACSDDDDDDKSINVPEVKQGNQKYQLFYSEDGGLMNTVNVTGKDDTIYPPEE